MVLAERETLNLALEALRGKLALPEEAVIQKEDNPYKNFDAIVQIMNVDFLCEVKNRDNCDHREYCKPIKGIGCNGEATGIADSQIHYANRYGRIGKQWHQHT